MPLSHLHDLTDDVLARAARIRLACFDVDGTLTDGRLYLDSEMTVVRNELEAGENNPVGVLMQRLRSTAYLWHNYGNTTIGARSDVEHVPIERLQAFYRTWYQPDNAVLIVAGK